MDGFNETLYQLCVSRKKLVNVTGELFSAGHRPILTALRLEFEDSPLILKANPDDDTLEVVQGKSFVAALDHENRILRSDDPWTSAIGRPLLWAWSMTNQQGYTDGMQLEFASNVEEESSVIQLMVLGSGFSVRTVNVER